MTVIRLCKDEAGYLWATALPDNVEDCENGPVLGPPEGLPKDVHNRLALAGIYNAFDLMGKRAVVVEILRDLGIPAQYVRTVIHKYQIGYFE